MSAGWAPAPIGAPSSQGLCPIPPPPGAALRWGVGRAGGGRGGSSRGASAGVGGPARSVPRSAAFLPEEAVNEVKRQAMSELQKAVSDAERKAHELITTERAKMERALAEAKRQASEDALTVINQQEDSSEVGAGGVSQGDRGGGTTGAGNPLQAGSQHLRVSVGTRGLRQGHGVGRRGGFLHRAGWGAGSRVMCMVRGDAQGPGYGCMVQDAGAWSGMMCIIRSTMMFIVRVGDAFSGTRCMVWDGHASSV